MVVRLRLQRFGRTHSPFYRMVAADSRSPRDGKHLEIVSMVLPLLLLLSIVTLVFIFFSKNSRDLIFG